MTDGLSAADVAMFSKYFTGETIYSAELSIDELEALVARMEDTEWETDLFKFVAVVESVLTAEQQKNIDSLEAAMSYCWQCCE
jgi:galactokinase/mevalonate kinase-like predicted kinase